MVNIDELAKTGFRFTIGLVTALLLGGCISYKAETNTVNRAIHEEGLLTQIELGTTTTAWLLEKFGAPQAVRRPDPSTAVWQYENVAHTRKAMRALPLFAITLEDSEATTYSFEVENDFIVKYWKD